MLRLALLPAIAAASICSAQLGAGNGDDGPINVPAPSPRFLPLSPLKGLAPVLLDTYGNSFGTAQRVARERNLQARILWIDATANISRYNTEQKIVDLVRQIRRVGFNTVVVDIKPIIGFTIYPSKFAAKLETWRQDVLPKEFDPLAIWVRETKAAGLSLLVSMNAFSEGHRDPQKGLGYDKPEWQTTLYEPATFVRSSFQTRPTYPLFHTANVIPPTEGSLGVFTDITKFPARLPDNTIAIIVDNTGKVMAKAEGQSIRQLDPNLPPGGSFMLGQGKGAEYLRLYAQPADKLELDSTPEFVRIQDRPAQQIPLMVNPNHPGVQQRLIEMVKEVVANYAVDGVIFDDRLRYGGMNADFGDYTKMEFEDYLKKSGMGIVKWPEDVFRWSVQPNLSRGLVPGPLYEAWLTFRAQTITNWLGRVRKAIQEMRPGTLLGVYAGSWYGEYPSFGSNYASNDFPGAFWFLRPEYQKTGFAHYLDILMTGCYYQTASIADALAGASNVGVTVEAGGQQTNRAAGDQAWSYAGIALNTYKDKDAVARALQAAVASTQGVMVFDLSHNIDQYWPLFEQAFSRDPRKAPHMEKDLLTWVRAHRDPRMRLPAILFGGASGTGL